nr:MAG TPA: hypothetical protein [Bacteriophage sp.]
MRIIFRTFNYIIRNIFRMSIAFALFFQNEKE